MAEGSKPVFTIRQILVPTDFSRHAAVALEHAALLGSVYGAEITLLHVDEFIVSPIGSMAIEQEYIAAYQSEKGSYLGERLKSLASGVSSNKVAVKTEILQGRAYKVIVEEAEKRVVDLIVIATRGLTHLATHLIGGTTERVVRFSRQPVLSVADPPRKGGKIESILCPTDLSPAANVALPYAFDLALHHGATIFIQYISELERPESEGEVMKRMPDLKELHPGADGVQVEYLLDRDVEPSNSIIRQSEENDMDLIVMSTHGRKGLRRVYVGNNTAEVVRQSTRPVLTVTHPFHKQMFARPLTQHHELGNLDGTKV